MRITGECFEYEVPDGWTAEQVRAHWVFRQAPSTELIVSGFVVKANSSAEEFANSHTSLLAQAVAAANRGAAHPDLRIIRPLEKDESISQVNCQTLISVTTAGDVVFCEAVVDADCGVLLIIFEAPNVAENLVEFARFLGTIRRSSSEVQPDE